METLIIYKLDFNENDYALALIILTKIVLSGKYHWTKFMNHKCFHI